MSEAYSDPYQILELERSASADEIKRAYFALVRANPPEREPERFKQIRAAYELLRDPQKRIETDMQLLQPWPAPAKPRRAPTPDLKLHQEDLLMALRALSDLDRRDWREHYVKIQV